MNHEEFENLAALEAIGAATEEESRSLQRHLASCSSCAEGAREFAEAATLMAQSLDPVAPPAAVRKQVLDSIRDDATMAETTLVGWRSRRMKPIWWLATAATFFLALWGWGELRVRTAETQIYELDAANKALEEARRRLERRNQNLAGTVEALTSSETRTIALSGEEIAPSASARVFLDPSGRRVFVFFHDLPRNAGDKSYQLWIIRADSPAPQPAGVFDVDENGEAQLSVKNLPVGVEIKALAVTLEPRGGVPAPTGKRYLLGTAG